MSGFTREEKFLNRLATRSFLQYWSWPSLYRNQGDSHKNGDGKEICDLTVVFGNDVLIFSDKRIEYSQEKEEAVAWSRWARRAIGSSVKQIKGARRWLREYPERVFIDKECKLKIPLSIPNRDDIKFHNVVVCHGIEGVLRQLNSEASFFFDNSIVGDGHWKGEGDPFCIGQIFEGDFVHIFNESTIELVLLEFDTAKDFINYLIQRERLLRSKSNIRIFLESDIVQLFYDSFDVQQKERIILPPEQLTEAPLIINRGGIEYLHSNPSYMARKAEDKVSYFWDDLIESFSFHILGGTTDFKSWNSSKEIEPGVRVLAKTSRFERRVVASSFVEFYEKAAPGQRGTRIVPDPANDQNVYLFCLVPQNEYFTSDSDYREIRRQMLTDYCAIAMHRDRQLRSVFGVACKTRKDNQLMSSGFFNDGLDFVYIDGESWGAEEYQEAEQAYHEYAKSGLLSKQKRFYKHEVEFPDVFRYIKGDAMNGKNRNNPCVCGSGLKFKRCCGRVS